MNTNNPRATPPTGEQAAARIAQLERERDDALEVLVDKQRITRLIDVAMFSEDRAAKQPALVDVLKSVERLVRERDTLRESLAAAREEQRLLSEIVDIFRKGLPEHPELVREKAGTIAWIEGFVTRYDRLRAASEGGRT